MVAPLPTNLRAGHAGVNVDEIPHARHVAVKIATDLKRMQRFYAGVPNDPEIDAYERELTFLLRHGFITAAVYGFVCDRTWVVAMKYHPRYGGVLIADDSPGRIPMHVDITNATFHSILQYTRRWADAGKVWQETYYKNAGCPELLDRRHNDELAAEPAYAGCASAIRKTYSVEGRGLIRVDLAPAGALELSRPAKAA